MSVTEKPSIPGDLISQDHLTPPKKPKGKLTQCFLNALYRHHLRIDVIDLLRQKYQLSLHEIQGTDPAIVQGRQKQYNEHLSRLKAIWAQEDEEYERSKID